MTLSMPRTPTHCDLMRDRSRWLISPDTAEKRAEAQRLGFRPLGPDTTLMFLSARTQPDDVRSLFLMLSASPRMYTVSPLDYHYLRAMGVRFIDGHQSERDVQAERVASMRRQLDALFSGVVRTAFEEE